MLIVYGITTKNIVLQIQTSSFYIRSNLKNLPSVCDATINLNIFCLYYFLNGLSLCKSFVILGTSILLYLDAELFAKNSCLKSLKYY